MSTPALPETYNGNPRVAWWHYSGEIAVGRFDAPDGSKDCVPYTLNGSGEWTTGAPPEPRPLFGLGSLRTDGPAFIAEGEKCTRALHGLGLAAVCSMGGSNAPAKSDWTPLQGRECIVIPDNDEPGEHYAQAVADLLDERPAVLRLEGLPPAGDIVDWLQTRLPDWDGFAPIEQRDTPALRDELLERADAAEVLEALEGDTPSEEWADPVLLPSTPPVPSFDPACLPDAFAPWIQDTADRQGSPIEFSAVAAMVCAGTLIGRQVFIRPKRADDWQEPCNLWGAAIGDPAAMKSPAIGEAIAPLRVLEAKAADEYDAEVILYERDLLAWRGVEAAAKKTAAKCTTIESAHAAFDELPPEPAPPVRTRFYTSDATPEKLCCILQDNPNGTLVLLDELSGLFHSFTRSGREGSRQLYLTGWGGRDSHTVDRIARGTGYIPAVCLSLLGSIQPGVLRECLLDDAARDGLAARLQLAVWPDLPEATALESRDYTPDWGARRKYIDTLEGLANLNPASIGAELDEHAGVYFLRFDEHAQASYYHWHDALMQRVRDDDIPGALREHLSKYRGLLPRLALVCHLADERRGPVGMPAFFRAQAWCELLEAHAMRIYSTADPSTKLARKILRVIPESIDERGRVTRRELQRLTLRGGPATPQFDAAIELLEAHSYLRLNRANRQGGTKEYEVNPAALEGLEAAT